MTFAALSEYILTFPEVTKAPHFHKISYRVRKKIVATITEEPPELVLKLSVIDQSVFCDLFPDAIQPVTGAWGSKGWTSIEFVSLKEEVLKDVLKVAYKTVAPASLIQLLEG